MPLHTMKAVRVHEFGGPEVLRYEDAPIPEPGRGEVLVRTVAIGVNPPDWYMREGMPDVPPEMLPPVTMPVTLGTDVSGVVAAVGDDAGDLAIGDEVFGMVRFPTSLQAGTYAEYVTAPAEDLARKPAGLSHEDAAASAMAALTAWQFLIDLGHGHPSPFQEAPHRPVPLAPGVRVLVNGAAGGVGHVAVQLAKWKGAHVIAVASGPHEQFVRELGADEFIDYTRERPEEIARDVDLVLDTVGRTGTRRLLDVVRRGGALFPVYMADLDAAELAERDVTATSTQVRSSGRQLAEIAELMSSGELRIAIDSIYRLADARQAHERASRGHLEGKIVLTVA